MHTPFDGSSPPFPDRRTPWSGGHLDRYLTFGAAGVDPRNIDVWLPPGYDGGARRFPVVYMHDGQNLFDASLSFSGVPWGMDVAIEKLIHEEETAGAIVVGIWNTPLRIPEYMPQKPMAELHNQRVLDRFVMTYGAPPLSDDYLGFIVHELKPFVDERYATLPERKDTFIMGSSMGGLISLYAFCEYPDVFGGAGCLSTSWTVAGRVMIPYLKSHIPEAATHKIYFDYGVEAHIAAYEAYQRKADRLFAQAGYVKDHNWMTERYPGAAHSEAAWRDRVDVPLRLLLTDDFSRSTDAEGSATRTWLRRLNNL